MKLNKEKFLKTEVGGGAGKLYKSMGQRYRRTAEGDAGLGRSGCWSWLFVLG